MELMSNKEFWFFEKESTNQRSLGTKDVGASESGGGLLDNNQKKDQNINE